MGAMPFGKFKGRRIADLPDAYVSWLLATNFLREPLRSAVLAEAVARGLVGGVPTASPARPRRVAEVIEAGWRQLALRHHPDRGGDHGVMVEIIEARDFLRSLVGSA
jgi:hypothetical protein